MAMGTVPCLLWKWWTWWVVLREEETLAATAGQGSTNSARESTSLNRKAGLAHNAGGAAGALDASTNPRSTSTSCSMRAGPGMNKRPLPLVRNKQEESISKESRAHDPLLSGPGRKNVKERDFFFFKKPINEKRSFFENPKMNWIGKKEKAKNLKILFERQTPRFLQQSSGNIQKLLTGSLRATTTPNPPSNYSRFYKIYSLLFNRQLPLHPKTNTHGFSNTRPHLSPLKNILSTALCWLFNRAFLCPGEISKRFSTHNPSLHREERHPNALYIISEKTSIHSWGTAKGRGEERMAEKSYWASNSCFWAPKSKSYEPLQSEVESRKTMMFSN